MNAFSAMTLGRWIQRRPLLGYFALAFAISWGGIVMMALRREPVRIAKSAFPPGDRAFEPQNCGRT